MDLLNGTGGGVGGGAVGVWLSLVSGGCAIGGGGVTSISTPVLAGVTGGVVSFSGEWGGIGDGSLSDWGGVVVSSGGGVVSDGLGVNFGDVVVSSSQGEDGGR